jgi:TRAP-type C4-dicarboxylate transport system permease small subunit
VRFIEQFQKGAEKLAWIFFSGSVIAIFCLFLLIFADMALRTTISLSIEGGIEISEYILVAIGFLGLGYAQLKGGHVNVDVVLLRLSPRTQRIISVLILVALIVFFVSMGQQIAKDAYVSWATKDYRSGTTLLIPTWPPKLVAFTGTGMLVLSLIVQLTRIITDLSKSRTSE